MPAPNQEICKHHFWLILGLVLTGSLLNACVSSQRTMARNKAIVWADVVTPPDGAELLFEDTGISTRDWRGCWSAYRNRVYGTDDLALTVMDHYSQTLNSSQGWVKNSIIAGDDVAVYDHPDGSSMEISTDIDFDFPNQYKEYKDRYRTLFLKPSRRAAIHPAKNSRSSFLHSRPRQVS